MKLRVCAVSGGGTKKITAKPRYYSGIGQKIPTDMSLDFAYGGAEEDRTPDLRIANATLSQLSYGPTTELHNPCILYKTGR